MEFTTGNSKVDAMAALQLTGNVIPQIWYKTILRENGKPDLLAITILADICYWYRPTELRDEQTGQFLGYVKKFRDNDLLQRSYAQFADMFGESKRSITDAIVRLEKLGVIKRVFRTIEIGGMLYNNVLFIDLFPDELYKLTYPEVKEGENESDTPVPKFRERGHDKKGEGSRNLGRQNTKNTTENTSKSNSSSSGRNTKTESSSNGGNEDDDNRIKERLSYDAVKKKYPVEIVEMVFEELKRRPDALVNEISATDFRTICENISDYVKNNSIYNKTAFVKTCFDNLITGTGCRGKPQNTFFHFPQHDYDFEAIENALLEKQINGEERKKKHEPDR